MGGLDSKLGDLSRGKQRGILVLVLACLMLIAPWAFHASEALAFQVAAACASHAWSHK